MSGNTGMGEKFRMMSSNSTSGGMMQGGSHQMSGKSGMMMSGGSSSNGMNNNQMMMTMPDSAKLQGMITEGSLLGHIVFGAVLGAVKTLLLIKTQARSKEKSKLKF